MEYILELEETEKFGLAYEEYKKEYSISQDFILWKHYYFFLWYAIVDDFPFELEEFTGQDGIAEKLKETAIYGMQNFKHNPEALFVLGYTINLFPFYFGDYCDWEKTAIQMLESAANLAPNEIVYTLAYLGTCTNIEMEKYNELRAKAASDILLKFDGIGFYNEYFKSVYIS